MARGGRREGAGRKVGVPIKKTQEIIRLAAEKGISPFEVMLENMHYYRDGGIALTSRLEEMSKGISAKDILEGNESVQEFFKMLDKVVHFRDRAQECAVDAAPYVHPKLASVEFRAPPSGAVDEVKRLMSPKDAAKAWATTMDQVPVGK